MTTYVYETIPAKAGEKPRYFEIRQEMKAKALTEHPETGEAIRRVVLAGFGVLNSKGGAAKKESGSPCCGPSCCCG